MKKRFSKYLKADIIRAIARKVCSMMVIAVLLAVLWDRFVNTSGLVSTRMYVFPVFGGIFLIVAWFCFLRMDGFKLMFSPKQKKQKWALGNLNDMVQTPLDNDEEFTPKERAFCSLVASLICSVVCWLISVV